LIHRASQYAEELVERSSEARGITARQILVLETLAASDRLSQTAICTRTGIDRSTLADIVRRLVSKGWLSRRRSREDARQQSVRITDEGRRVLDGALPMLREIDGVLQRLLGPKLEQEFAAALVAIWNAADAAPADGEPALPAGVAAPLSAPLHSARPVLAARLPRRGGPSRRP